MKNPWTSVSFVTLICTQSGNGMLHRFRPNMQLQIPDSAPAEQFQVYSEDSRVRHLQYELRDNKAVHVHVDEADAESLRKVHLTTNRDGRKISFIVLADSGVPNFQHGNKMEGFHKDIGEKLGSFAGKVDFVVLAGDNFYDHGVKDCADPQWKEVWFDRLRVAKLKVPFFSVLGNHDVEGAPGLQNVFQNCEGVDEEMAHYWVSPSTNYHVAVNREINLVFINTNEVGTDPVTRKKGMNVIASQAIKDIKPDFVVGHHPMYAAGPTNKKRVNYIKSDGTLHGESIAAAHLREHPFLFYLCGHVHGMQFHRGVNHKQILVGGGGGTLATGLGSNPQHGSSSSFEDIEAVVNDIAHGFAVITIDLTTHKSEVEYHRYIGHRKWVISLSVDK